MRWSGRFYSGFFLQFIWECRSERIVKIGYHLAKLLTKLKGCPFYGPQCIIHSDTVPEWRIERSIFCCIAQYATTLVKPMLILCCVSGLRITLKIPTSWLFITSLPHDARQGHSDGGGGGISVFIPHKISPSKLFFIATQITVLPRQAVHLWRCVLII